MAKRKQKQDIDITVDKEVQAPAAEPVAVGQPVPPLEKEVPELTVRIFPVRNAKSKLRATANVNNAGAFAVQGFRIFDSRNGLFVKEPERTYIKDGTEMSQSVFFPITKEAREKLYGQILHSYDLVMDQQQAQSQSVDVPFVTDEDAPPLPEEISPEDDLPFGEMTM